MARKRIRAQGLDGVAFTRNAQPDLSPFIYFGKDGVPGMVDLPALTGNRQKDFDMANAMMGYKEQPDGYTWHHHEGNRMILVETVVHDAVKHAGTVSQLKAETGDPTVYK